MSYAFLYLMGPGACFYQVCLFFITLFGKLSVPVPNFVEMHAIL